MRILMHLALMAFLILQTGCIESNALIDLNPDGSGIITIRSFRNPNMAAMLKESEDLDLPHRTPEEEAAHIKKTVIEMAKDLGEATYVNGRPMKNKQGWQGYEGRFAFKDINNVILTMKFALENACDGQMGSQTPPLTFDFEPGSPARLAIHTSPGEEEEEPEADGNVTKVSVDITETMDPDVLVEEMQSFAPLCKHMRESVMLRVNGTVVKSNAPFPIPGRENAFTLLDIHLGRALEDEAFIRKMNADEDIGDGLVNHPAYKLQNPQEPVTIEFK